MTRITRIRTSRQTYLRASHSEWHYFCFFFLISRWDGENNGLLAGIPFLPPPSFLAQDIAPYFPSLLNACHAG